MQRKLVTIQIINDLKPIKDADFIENASVLGWSLITKKNEFKVGDKCVFFEIDSILPSNVSWSQFLKERNFRIKTIRMKGVLSQGLALPISILPTRENEYEVGEDVTELLNVIKHEIPITNLNAAGNFPYDVSKTDEIRLQSIPEILNELKDKPFNATVKMDGMSATFIKREDKFQVCSRNFELKEGFNEFWNIAKKYDLANRMPMNFVIQGELVGPGIQKNRLSLKENDLFVFNVFNLNTKKYMEYDDMVIFCERLDIKCVPLAFSVNKEELKTFNFTVENFLELAKGTYDSSKNRREGIVIRPKEETTSSTLKGDRFSFKVINNEFLLRDED